MKRNIYALLFFIIMLILSTGLLIAFLIDNNKGSKDTQTMTDATETSATLTDIQTATDTNIEEIQTYTDTIETPTDTDVITTEETTEILTEENATMVDATSSDTTEVSCNKGQEPQVLEHTIEDIPNPTTTEAPAPVSPAISDYEFSLLCQVVECETHGADRDSKVHIVHVVRNRIYRREWGSTWSSVILEPYQFGKRSDVTQSTIDAVNYALTIEDTTYGSIAFHSGGYSSTFFGYRYVFTDAVGHHFYI